METIKQGVVLDAAGYERLAGVFGRAFHQAAHGKGAERHADNKPFHRQPMQEIADRRGIGFILGQADKKSEEAQGMLDRGGSDAAVRELLGAINYLAGAIIFIEKNRPAPAAANDNRPEPGCALTSGCSAPLPCSLNGKCLAAGAHHG